MRTIDVDLPDALVSHRSGFERAYRQNRIVYQQVLGYFDADICRILGRQQVTVVDVGANTGLFSMEVLRRTGGRARLYCFEPIPATYRRLEANIHPLGLADTHLFNCGLGQDDVSATFMYNRLVDAMSSRYDMWGAGDDQLVLAMIYDKRVADRFHVRLPAFLKYLPRWVNGAVIASLKYLFLRTIGKSVPVQCRMTTLSRVIAECGIDRIDLLKVDVENAELDVLLGISDADWAKIGAVVLEVHDLADRQAVIERLLARHGFDRIVVDRHAAGQTVFSMSAFKDGVARPGPASSARGADHHGDSSGAHRPVVAGNPDLLRRALPAFRHRPPAIPA